MNKTPEEREAAAQRRVEVMIQNLKEGVARDKPITDKIIEELDRKHALKMKAAGSSKTTASEDD